MAIYTPPEITEAIQTFEDKSILPYIGSERSNTTMLATIPGAKWQGTYFKRYVDNLALDIQYDEELSPTNMDLTRINNMVINVEDALPATATTDIVGTGIIDAGFIPNPNDFFLTKIPNGSMAMFTITGVSRLNYNNTEIFKIEYKIYKLITDISDTTYTSILDAVSNELYYNIGHRINNLPILIDSDEKSNRDDLASVISRLHTHWAKKFITQDSNYFVANIEVIDLVAHVNYDPYMSKLLYNVMGRSNIAKKLMSVSYIPRTYSVLDLIYDRGIEVNTISRYVDKQCPREYADPHVASLGYIGIDNIIELKDSGDTEDIPVYEEDTRYPILPLNTYIFHNHIYDMLNGLVIDVILTKFESLFLSTFNGNFIDIKDVIELSKTMYKLTDMQQFYFIPILNYIANYTLTRFTVKYM